MTKYAGLFGESKAVPVPKGNLFGEERKLVPTIKDIESWRASKGPMTTTANRINFILNGTPIAEVRMINVTDVGAYQVDEATEANKCVDKVVTDFAAMKSALETPRYTLMTQIKRIEEATNVGFMGKLLGKKSNWIDIRSWVTNGARLASEEMDKTIKYHLTPFLAGLADAKYYLDKISEDLNNAINTLDYVHERSPDKTVQDLALRRKEMFAKSLALMNMNKGQLDQMTMFCEKQKQFAEELDMTIKPLIENILRTAVLSDTDGEASMKEIHTKLKALL